MGLRDVWCWGSMSWDCECCLWFWVRLVCCRVVWAFILLSFVWGEWFLFMVCLRDFEVRFGVWGWVDFRMVWIWVLSRDCLSLLRMGMSNWFLEIWVFLWCFGWDFCGCEWSGTTTQSRWNVNKLLNVNYTPYCYNIQ